MGEGKRRQRNRAQVLAEYPWCIYCGAPATTTDHCPPRAIFRRRVWPETYEFPCCDPCNDAGRRDEQVVSVLARIRGNESELERAESDKQLQGLWNNQPEVMREWMPTSRNEVRRHLRKNLGDLGDELRRAGWGITNLGPLTVEALDRFSHRLAKALFFRQVGERFEGAILTFRYSVLDGTTFDTLREILQYAPMGAEIFRSNQPLSDQFNYRFNASSELSLLYAVAELNPQMIFQIVALSHRALIGFNEHRASLGLEPVHTDQEDGRIIL